MNHSIIQEFDKLKTQVEKLVKIADNEKPSLEKLKNTIIENLKTKENAVTDNRAAIDFLKEKNLLKLEDFIKSVAFLNTDEISKLPSQTLEFLIEEFNYCPRKSEEDMLSLPLKIIKVFIEKIIWIPYESMVMKMFEKDYVFSSPTFEKEIFLTDLYCSKHTEISLSKNIKNMNLDFLCKLNTPIEKFLICTSQLLEECVDKDNYDLADKIIDEKNLEQFINFLITKDKIPVLSGAASKIKTKFLIQIQKIVFEIVLKGKFDDGIDYGTLILKTFESNQINVTYVISKLRNYTGNHRNVNIMILHCMSYGYFYKQIIENLTLCGGSPNVDASFNTLVDLIRGVEFKFIFCNNEKTPEVLLNRLFKNHILFPSGIPKNFYEKVTLSFN